MFNIKKVAVAAAAVGAVSASAVAMSQPASASPGFTYRDVQTGRCLDSNSAGQLYTLPCNGGAYQRWAEVTHQFYDGRWGLEIVDVATGRCLDADDIGHAYTQPCNSGLYQDWSHVNVANEPGNEPGLQSVKTGRLLLANKAAPSDPNAAAVYAEPGYFSFKYWWLIG